MAANRHLLRVDLASLEAMTTRALLGRLRALLGCQASAADSDLTGEELAGLTGISFKDSPEWKEAHADVKAVLAHREHVPGGAERRGKRLERARASRSTEHRRRK